MKKIIVDGHSYNEEELKVVNEVLRSLLVGKPTKIMRMIHYPISGCTYYQVVVGKAIIYDTDDFDSAVEAFNNAFDYYD